MYLQSTASEDFLAAFSPPPQVLAKPRKLERGSPDKEVKLGQKLSFFFPGQSRNTPKETESSSSQARTNPLNQKYIAKSTSSSITMAWGALFLLFIRGDQILFIAMDLCQQLILLIASALTYFYFIRNGPFVF